MATLKLLTEVDAGTSGIGLSFSDKVLVLGSCFADNIGKKMSESGFDVCVNPFGTLYNPVSICNSLSRLSSGVPFCEDDCVAMGAGSGLVCSFSHHTSFARRTSEEFLEAANSSLEKAVEFYNKTNKLIITLGTAWCYRYKATGETVSNCLKRPEKEFDRYRLSVSEAVALLSSALDRLGGRNVFFTLSPIRHLRDGAHGNGLSKSTLLMAEDMVCASHADTAEYFPAYEIMMDELRDYRFYADDMVHPSPLAVDYLWQRFIDFALLPGERQKLLDNEKLFRRSRHVPMHE